ncbi:cbb3-type cytochrome c oxidase subunit I [Microbacterium sp. LRZ72]|uniref:cytochrome c oxidase subunit I n=1 Tax=Microbacterium sp. LRZ72 TaxID=2942481 RepID=UPI0029A70E54|nr:cbb3-type cytochrome c oxidase subunit I [Microbacterium sp. LRZ72]MDX2377260.1 cbb3-type cytochrome c oxidase subunit I [Microbacterium sp. LRZ72]
MTSTAPPQLGTSFEEAWRAPRGLRGLFTAVQHKSVGTRFMLTAFAFFLIGGVQALLMRVQLAQPGNDFLGPQAYNELFTMHGSTMMFLFAVPFLEGLATYLVPLMIGSRDLPFPRLNAFNYWCYLFGGVILYSSYLFALVPDAGWFAYVPLSGDFSDGAMDFWLLGLTLAEIAAIGAAIELAVGILCLRAPGMGLHRMPIFAWTMLAVAFMIIAAFVPLTVATVLLELDRTVGTAFFDSDVGGSPLLWQHLFWIFGHPEVYVMFLPGAAIISHVVPVHARRPLVAYPLIVIAIATTAVMSLGLWVHHMYTVGLPSVTMSFFTAASMSISLASGLQVFAWIVTLWLGRPRLTVPMLYAIGFIITFVAGGITGVMVASTPFDQQVHDTYFVVAHFHYVLIGGMLFPIFAALHHWWGKFTGRHYAAAPAVTAFLLIFVGFHTTFFPMHLTGLWGMPRRVFTYGAELGVTTVNLLSTIGAFMLAAGVLVLTVNLVLSLVRGRPSVADPWHGDTLEWTTSSPPPSENWPTIPVVTSREPGWDRYAAPARFDRVREAFDHAPIDVRATPVTSTIAAEPRGAALLPAPTWWPIVPPVGIAVISVAVLSGWYPLAFAGIAIALVGFGGWAFVNESEQRADPLPPVGGEFSFEDRGARAIGWWAALSIAITMTVAIATLAFSALFLQVNAPVWPFEPATPQPLLSAGVALLLALAALAAWWASSGRPAARQLTTRGRHLVGVVVSAAAGAGALVLAFVLLAVRGLDPGADAYQSSAWALSLATCALIGVGIAGTLVALLARLRHRRDSRPAIVAEYAAVVWVGVLVCWAIAWVVIDVLPEAVI